MKRSLVLALLVTFQSVQANSIINYNSGNLCSIVSALGTILKTQPGMSGISIASGGCSFGTPTFGSPTGGTPGMGCPSISLSTISPVLGAQACAPAGQTAVLPPVVYTNPGCPSVTLTSSLPPCPPTTGTTSAPPSAWAPPPPALPPPPACPVAPADTCSSDTDCPVPQICARSVSTQSPQMTCKNAAGSIVNQGPVLYMSPKTCMPCTADPATGRTCPMLCSMMMTCTSTSCPTGMSCQAMGSQGMQCMESNRTITTKTPMSCMPNPTAPPAPPGGTPVVCGPNTAGQFCKAPNGSNGQCTAKMGIGQNAGNTVYICK